MAIDKNIDYVIQDGYENYTKNSDSVTVPRKFKSRKDATPTKLAYITKDEAKMLKKMKKGTPHKGPSGIPSYDDFDAKGNYRSGAAMSAAETGGNTDRDRRDMAQAGISPQEAQALRSAAINAGAGQRVNPGFFDSRTNLTPAEIRAAKAARRDPTNKYGARSFRNTGQSGIMNMIRSGGLLGSLARGIGQFFGLGKKPGEATYDMSEFSDLGLLSDRINPTFQNDLDNELMLSTQKTPTSNVPMGTPWDNPYKEPMGTPWDNPYKGPGKYEQAETDYWSNKVIGPNGIVINTDTGMEVVDMPTAPMGTPWDNPYREPTVIEDIFEGSGVDPMYQTAGLYNTPDGAIPYWGADQYNYNEGMLNTPDKPIIMNFAKDGGRIGYANGGLASMFTRRR